ncbi:glycosyltransferase family 4 protein [Nisaea sp.]|uniref:glycosyltransferase family 4 protein n=1 Tax=Nisaea sp. TaxID=2024842 RepID=UPI002B27418D|nr:glycosyltransferase family 4 protein [Nisaea sp.]
MSRSLAPVSIYVGNSSGIGFGDNPFGKDVANVGLFRAIAKYSRHPGQLNFLSFGALGETALEQGIFPWGAPTRSLGIASLFEQDKVAASGCLLRGSAEIAELAWKRRGRGDRSYSIVGVVHTLAPPAIREYISRCLVSPIQPWDALICTSPSVKQGLEQMFGDLGRFIADRGGTTASVLPMPHLPVIPLGVDASSIARRMAEVGGRDQARAALQIADDEIVVLWLGRMSYYEKANPSPMFQAVEQAARLSGKKMRFIMAGWFPNETVERPLYEQAALGHAPSVRVEFADGNDRNVVARCWAGSDIFLSLVDNIQETFGITPVEAMAAGLPVVLSDWDGYRSTVQNGVQGLQIPTMLPPSGDGQLMAERIALGLDNYLQYASNVSQHTAVDVDAAAASLSDLAGDPELRARMGDAGQDCVRQHYDWPVVVAKLDDLWDDLAALRMAAEGFGTNTADMQDPVKGDPFHSFAHFPTCSLDGDTVLEATEQSAARFAKIVEVGLDMRLQAWRAPVAEEVIAFVRHHGPVQFSMIEDRFSAHRGMRLDLLVTWLCKYGVMSFSAGS